MKSQQILKQTYNIKAGRKRRSGGGMHIKERGKKQGEGKYMKQFEQSCDKVTDARNSKFMEK